MVDLEVGPADQLGDRRDGGSFGARVGTACGRHGDLVEDEQRRLAGGKNRIFGRDTEIDRSAPRGRKHSPTDPERRAHHDIDLADARSQRAQSDEGSLDLGDLRRGHRERAPRDVAEKGVGCESHVAQKELGEACIPTTHRSVRVQTYALVRGKLRKRHLRRATERGSKVMRRFEEAGEALGEKEPAACQRKESQAIVLERPRRFGMRSVLRAEKARGTCLDVGVVQDGDTREREEPELLERRSCPHTGIGGHEPAGQSLPLSRSGGIKQGNGPASRPASAPGSASDDASVPASPGPESGGMGLRQGVGIAVAVGVLAVGVKGPDRQGCGLASDPLHAATSEAPARPASALATKRLRRARMAWRSSSSGSALAGHSEGKFGEGSFGAVTLPSMAEGAQHGNDEQHPDGGGPFRPKRRAADDGVFGASSLDHEQVGIPSAFGRRAALLHLG